MKSSGMSLQAMLLNGMLAMLLSLFAVSPGFAGAVPAFSATVTGPISSRTVSVSISVANDDKYKPGNMYVLARMSSGAWYGLTGGNWVEWGGPGTPVPVYYSTLQLDDRTFEIKKNASLLAFEGAELYVGYGSDDNDMLSLTKHAKVYTLTDANLHQLPVKDTDGNIKYASSVSHVYRTCDNNQCADDDMLFVFFPGTNGIPLEHQRLAEAIGETGIRVLVLAYDNDDSEYHICNAEGMSAEEKDACFANVRRDRVEGSSSSQYVLSTADGVKNRLLKALIKLNWTQFYSGDQILFGKIIFGGFSQGAGVATWIGKNYSVPRVCQFSGTWDGVGSTTSDWRPATWLNAKDTDKTPKGAFYGFSHRYDSGDGMVLDLNWQALGMGTDLPRLYSSGFYGQKIYTDDQDCGGSPHECSSKDDATPLNADGTPRYAAAWRYVCHR